MSRRKLQAVTLAAAGILLVSMGVRQSLGLFMAPIAASTAVDIASFSLALAIGQFSWGAIQPLAGILADRHGPQPVLIGGILLLALGCMLTPLMHTGFGLTLSLGLLAAMGSGASSFSVLIGAAAQRIPAESRGMASGIINAGGSLGQFLFAPLSQRLIQLLGWMGAMGALALLSLTALPLIRPLLRTPPRAEATAAVTAPAPLRHVLRQALSDRSYLLLHAGFFTCGFHVAFLVTHLPGEVQLCGLPGAVASWSLALIGLANIFGSLLAGSCITRFRSRSVLAVMYASRTVLIALYLVAPHTPLVFYLFAAGLGLTWLSTVPPTASLVGKLFGGFFGAWLGGLAVTHTGNYLWIWQADMALALLAALLNLPIREAPVVRPATT